MQILMGGIINGNDYKYIGYNWNGLGNIKMIENIVSIGLTTICGVFAMYWFYRSMSN